MSAGGVERPRLETTRLLLRPPTLADADAIERMVGDARVAEMTSSIPHPYPAGGAAEFIRSLATAAAIDLAVERKADGAVIGMSSIRPLDGWRIAELGYYVGVPYWRQGYATEAAQRLVDYGFAVLGVQRFANHVFAGNLASARVMAKLGHRRSGEGEIDYPLRGRRRVWHFELLRPVTRKSVLVAAVALVDPDGRVLLAQRPPGKSMAGLWEFPGGKLEPGETPEAALIRELREELGIDVAAACLAPFTFASHAYADFHLLMPLYVCRRWNGIVMPREGQVLKWVRPAQMDGFPMPPADVPLVAMLRDLL